MTEIQKARIYTAYLVTQWWESLRLDALHRAGFKCQTCGSRHCLKVHHNTYENITFEAPEDVFVMCDQCHTKFHSHCQVQGRQLSEIDYSALLQFVELNSEDPSHNEKSTEALEKRVCLGCGRSMSIRTRKRFCSSECEDALALRNVRGY